MSELGISDQSATAWANRLQRENRLLDQEMQELLAAEDNLRHALQNVVDSAHTDSDTCPICLSEIDNHSSGCSIANAVKVLEGAA